MTPTERAIKASHACTFNRDTTYNASVLCIICAAQIIKDATSEMKRQIFDLESYCDNQEAEIARLTKIKNIAQRINADSADATKAYPDQESLRRFYVALSDLSDALSMDEINT